MRFVSLVTFTNQGVHSIQQTTERAATFTGLASQSGVEIEQLLWLTGRFDGLMVFNAPDAETASALMLDLARKGNVTTETCQAFDAEEMDRVVAKLT